ncbi:MAG: YceI family protein [Actinomycetota bacterium]|nr:YceI family protein [Actinomycetota bacterium]
MTTITPTTTNLPLQPGTWALDAAHSSVSFAVRHLGVSKVRGRFTDFDATVAVGDDLDSSSVEAVVQLASVDTSNADRDAHLQAEDMFDVARRPTMAFRSTSIVPDGDDWRLEGELTIGEVTKPLVLAVEFGGVEEYPIDGRRHAGFEASGELRRIDFGIAPGIPAPMLGDVVKVQLDIQLVAPADG